MKIKLTPEQVDEVVRKDLKSLLEYQLDPESDPNETFGNRYRLVKALSRTLLHYTRRSEQAEVYEIVFNGLCDLQDYYEQKADELNEKGKRQNMRYPQLVYIVMSMDDGLIGVYETLKGAQGFIDEVVERINGDDDEFYVVESQVKP